MNSSLQRELTEISRRVNLWQAELRGLLWFCAAAVVLCGLGFSDFLLRYGRSGRLACWGVLVAVAGVALGHLSIVLRRRRTDASVAAMLEHAFPVLDNHLINVVQFAAEPRGGKLVSAYLRQDVPHWRGLDLRAMRDRRRYARAYLAAVGAVLLLSAPCFWVGRAWPTALLRVLNPFDNRMPPTVATLIEVRPGNTQAVQGEPLDIACLVRGHKGQKVEMDLWPAGERQTTAVLGVLAGGGVETFTYHVAKVTGDLGYQVRAGDAMPSARFRIIAVPPLAFEKLRLRIAPQNYTGLPAAETDGLSGKVVVPQNAQVGLLVRCNRALGSASWSLDESPYEPLEPSGGNLEWSGTRLVSSGQVFRVKVVDRVGIELRTDVRFECLLDRAPILRVLAPAGRAVLTGEAAPGIQFEAADDYGLSQVVLQRLASADSATGTVVREWTLTGEKVFSAAWTGDVNEVAGGEVSYRLAAADNMQPGDPHRTVSAPIVFEVAASGTIMTQQALAVSAAGITLTRLTDLQRANLNATVKLDGALASTTPVQWQEVLQTQVTIRKIAGELLASPRRPLGILTATLKRAYDEPMAQAIDVVQRVLDTSDGSRPTFSRQSVAVETTILRMLSQIDAGMGQAQQHQTATGVLGLIDALVKGQQVALDQTREQMRMGGAVPATLVKREDALAGDAAQFVQICRGDDARPEATEADFAKLLKTAAELAESKKIRVNMLAAAEHLEGGRAADAVAPETAALTGLQEIQALLNQWRVHDAAEKMQQMKEAIEAAKATVDKLKAVESKVVDAIRATETQKDKTGEAKETVAEENKEIKAGMEAAALKLANDLQALPELPVGNELVQDLNQIYEEMKQVAGSESAPATELGLQKEDWILASLEAAAKRMDDMEMWLMATPDATKRNTETFDKQEMPKIGLISMPKELDDIIGDLLKQEEDIQKKSDDSTGNQGTSDIPAGWGIAEGEFTDYAAQGKSGNEAPEHKDQDGRSSVGREGMSDGEVVGASGKINEGDKHIEKRMTRDSSQGGQVQEEGQAEAKATGGGKLSGTADENGMPGKGPRRDAAADAPSAAGTQALLRRSAEAVYAQASLRHLRTGSMDKAIEHMRQAEDALARGLPMREVREFQRRAITAIKATQTELASGVAETALTGDAASGRQVDDQTASTPDEAPVRYRNLVSEYFKALGEKP